MLKDAGESIEAAHKDFHPLATASSACEGATVVYILLLWIRVNVAPVPGWGFLLCSVPAAMRSPPAAGLPAKARQTLCSQKNWSLDVFGVNDHTWFSRADTRPVLGSVSFCA